MDNVSKAIFVVIAVALCSIAFQLFSLNSTYTNTPKFGNFIDLKEIKDPKQRHEAQLLLIKSLPVIRLQGGQVDAEVSGSVTLEN